MLSLSCAVSNSHVVGALVPAVVSAARVHAGIVSVWYYTSSDGDTSDGGRGGYDVTNT